jgi:hypothetical protein
VEVYGRLSKNCRTDKMVSMGYNTYGIIREVTKTHAVQENWGRAKTVPLEAPQLYPYK